jgi:hypothetical protein
MPNWKKIALSGSNPEFASLNVDNAVSASAFTGSFVGDGSGLSNVSVAEVATVTDTFTSVTSSTVVHTFDTKNVIVQVYDNSDNLVIPQSITTSTTSSVDIVFDSITSGRVIVAKGGHIVTGSIQIASSSTVSDTFTAQTSYTASHTFGTSDVFVQVYDNTDSLILPQKVKILTTGSVGLDFDTTTTGKVIIGKSGHIVSGSSGTSIDLTAVSSNIVPDTNNTYDLGSPTKTWRDLYLSSASLYIDGTQVLSSTSETLTFTTDTGQSIKLLETGADDIILQTDTGNIELKGTVEILTGKKITDSAGTKVLFGDSIGITGSIDLTGTVDGIDLQAFSSSVATGLASSTADYTQLTNVPSGIISSSAQIATDISGSSTLLSSSIAGRVAANELFSSSLSTTPITYTGSFVGDGTSLTGVTSYTDSDTLSYINSVGVLSGSAQIAANISGSFTSTSASIATDIANISTDFADITNKPTLLSGSAQITSLTSYTETFTGSAAVTASHNLGTKNVTISIYDDNDYMIFPTSVKTHDTNDVYVQFNQSRSGRIVITK